MQTSWGSRADGDANDDVRLTPRPKRATSLKTPPNGHDLIRYRPERHFSEKNGEKESSNREVKSHVTFSRLGTPSH